MLIALTLLTLQAAPLGVAPSPLPQAQQQARADALFAELDVDENGRVERDEVRAHFDLEASAQATYDAARQSTKASQPRAPIVAPRHDWAKADGWFAVVDTDQDGQITRAELNAHLATLRADVGVF